MGGGGGGAGLVGWGARVSDYFFNYESNFFRGGGRGKGARVSV